MTNSLWNDITRNWKSFTDAISSRYPEVDPNALRMIRGDKGRLVEHLAERHDLTRTEADEELETFVMVQMLAGSQSHRRAG